MTEHAHDPMNQYNVDRLFEYKSEYEIGYDWKTERNLTKEIDTYLVDGCSV